MPSTAGNGVWVLPGSHKLGKADIRRLVAGSGSDRIEGAVPMLCAAGDTIVTNRQLLHGSFANSSPDRRITLNDGFFPQQARAGRDGAAAARRDRDLRPGAHRRAHAASSSSPSTRAGSASRRSRAYVYRPLAGQEENNRWNETTRETVLKNYNQRDMFI